MDTLKKEYQKANKNVLTSDFLAGGLFVVALIILIFSFSSCEKEIEETDPFKQDTVTVITQQIITPVDTTSETSKADSIQKAYEDSVLSAEHMKKYYQLDSIYENEGKNLLFKHVNLNDSISYAMFNKWSSGEIETIYEYLFEVIIVDKSLNMDFDSIANIKRYVQHVIAISDGNMGNNILGDELSLYLLLRDVDKQKQYYCHWLDINVSDYNDNDTLYLNFINYDELLGMTPKFIPRNTEIGTRVTLDYQLDKILNREQP